MTLIKNPYTIGRPIYAPESLFGRHQKIVSFIQEQLTFGAKVIVLHGQRRIGMTSCMNYISRSVRVDGFIFIPLSLQDKHHSSLDEILYDFARDIIDWLGISRSTITIPSQEDLRLEPREFFGTFLKEIYSKLDGKSVVLLLDEFDVLLDDNSSQINPLINFLTSIINREEKLFIILFLGRRKNSLEFISDSFGRKVPRQELGLLNKSDTENLITEIANGVIEYQPETIKEIWELTGGHPYYTQLLCFSLFQQARKLNQWNVNPQDIEGIIDESLGKGEAAFVSTTEILSPREKLVLYAVAEAKEIATNSSQSDIFMILERHHVKLTKKIKEELTKAAEHLVDLGFLQKIGEQKSGKTIIPVYKVKIELFRLWLLKRFSLQTEIEKIINSKTNQNLTETNNNYKIPMANENNDSQRPSQIAQIRSLVVVVAIIISLLGYSFFRILNSLESKASRSECFKLLDDINIARSEQRKRSQVIKETRNKWSRKEESLDAQCPYTETDKLDAKYNKLLHLYGSNIIDRAEYEEAIIPLCEITEEYEESSKIKDIFVKWISTDGAWDRKKIIEKLIEQNQPENDCLIYSFKNPRNKDQLYEQQKQLYEQINKQYYQEAQKYIKKYDFKKAVESYCKISKEYDGFDDIVEQLKGWLSNDSDLYPNERQKVEEKLQELNNQCPVSPLNDITN